MGILNREQLLTKEDLKVERVDFGDDEYVFVRQMTGRERDRFEQSIVTAQARADGTTEYIRKLEDFRAKLAVQTLCNEEGELLLKPGDVAALSMSMSAARLELIVDTAQRLNRMSPEDTEALIKNSEDVPSEGSTSG